MYRILLITTLLFSVSCAHRALEDGKIGSVITSVKSKYAPDGRVSIFSIEYKLKDGVLALSGEATNSNSVSDLLEKLDSIGIEAVSEIKVLPDPALKGKYFGVVNNSVGNLRSEPRHSAELATQATLGMPLNVLKQEGEWYLVQTPDDYIAWIDHGGLVLFDQEEFDQWKRSKKIIFTEIYGFSYADLDKSQVVGDLVLGNVLTVLGETDDFYKCEYPDKRISFVSKSESSAYNAWVSQLDMSSEQLLEPASLLTGTPYLWGGTSAKGMDCSGFTKTIYLMNGMIIPRDASQQVHAGMLVDEERNWDQLQVGDLLFFGTPATETGRERVVHVGMWIGDGQFIHASQKVRISSMNPEDANFDQFNLNRYLRTKRYIGDPRGNIIQLSENAVFTNMD